MANKWIYRIIAGFIIALLLYVFFPNSEPNLRPNLWNIQDDGNQLTILGLAINQQQLQDAIAIIRETPEIALFTTRQKKGEPEPPMHLEAYFPDAYDQGDRIIIGLDAKLEMLQHIKKEAFHPQLFPNDVIRVGVREALVQRILSLPIHNITILAGRPIMFEDFKKKFGEPKKFIDDGHGNAHFLYPKLGLDFIQPSDGLQILQFVAPSRFEKDLLKPLMSSLPKGV